MTVEAAEAELVRSSMRHLVTTCTPIDLATQLVDSGWGELMATDTEFAVGILAEEIGREATAAPVLELVLQYGLGHGVGGPTGVVLPPMARGGEMFAGRIEGDDIVVKGLVMAGFERAKAFLVAVPDGVLTVDTVDLGFKPTGAGDPALGLQAVTGRAQRTAPSATAEDWSAAVAHGRRALASELIGLTERMLDDTIVYVSQRQQFGRAIASFQTVKHRLADVRVALGAARNAIRAAWSDDTDLSAMAALCLAARAQHLAATHCHQVHGGIAFTVEHGFHRFIRHGQMISGLLGHPDDLLHTIGMRLSTSHVVPRTPLLS